jgi:putative ABC transport system substrate-binding protein
MTKNLSIVGLCFVFLALSFSVRAQQPPKIHTIGFLSGASLSSTANRVEAFRQGLLALGYVEGKNIVIQRRFADGKLNSVGKLAEELVRLKAEIIVVAGGEPVALAATRVTQTIPIVMANAFDPVASGLVKSLAKPGGNVTGLTSLTGPEIFGKQTEILRDTVPKLIRLGVLTNPDNSFGSLAIKEIEAAAKTFVVTLYRAEARNPDQFEAAFNVFSKGRVDALIEVQDPMFIDQSTRLVDLETKSSIPTMHSSPEYVDAGGLMSYGTNRTNLFRRAATYVDKILKGAKPADLPVEHR